MADSLLTGLTAATSVAVTDLLYAVTDPGGSPADRKVPFSVVRDALPGILLASVSYNPGSPGTASSTSTSYTDMDATNLAVTFTPGASGKVLIRLSARASATSNTEVSWNLRVGAADVTGTLCIVAYDSTSSIGHRAALAAIVTGLTPGTPLTYKWGIARSFGAGTCSTLYGGTNGAAVMEVWSA